MSNNMRDEDAAIEECMRNFYTVATLQGRMAYLFMSIHAVNPEILNNILPFDPHHILWCNMFYGTTLHLYARPNMGQFTLVHRAIFSILGSLMFNYSTMRVFRYFAERLDERPLLMTILGFTAGRIMMFHFLAYLYHVDSRTPGTTRRDAMYDSMYN